MFATAQPTQVSIHVALDHQTYPASTKHSTSEKAVIVSQKRICMTRRHGGGEVVSTDISKINNVSGDQPLSIKKPYIETLK